MPLSTSTTSISRRRRFFSVPSLLPASSAYGWRPSCRMLSQLSAITRRLRECDRSSASPVASSSLFRSCSPATFFTIAAVCLSAAFLSSPSSSWLPDGESDGHRRRTPGTGSGFGEFSVEWLMISPVAFGWDHRRPAAGDYPFIASLASADRNCLSSCGPASVSSLEGARLLAGPLIDLRSRRSKRISMDTQATTATTDTAVSAVSALIAGARRAGWYSIDRYSQKRPAQRRAGPTEPAGATGGLPNAGRLVPALPRSPQSTHCRRDQREELPASFPSMWKPARGDRAAAGVVAAITPSTLNPARRWRTRFQRAWAGRNAIIVATPALALSALANLARIRPIRFDRTRRAIRPDVADVDHQGRDTRTAAGRLSSRPGRRPTSVQPIRAERSCLRRRRRQCRSHHRPQRRSDVAARTRSKKTFDNATTKRPKGSVVIDGGL